MATSIKDSLLYEVSPPVASSANKVTVVGVGMVGMACAFSVLTQVITTFDSEYFNRIFKLIFLCDRMSRMR